MHTKNLYRYYTSNKKKKNEPKYNAHKNLIIEKVYLTTYFSLNFPC